MQSRTTGGADDFQRFSKIKSEVGEMEQHQSSFAAAGLQKKGLSQVNRQRAFAIRRLNMLSTRQKAGLRRKEWIRRANKDGRLVWTRHADLALAVANVKKSKKQKKSAESTFDDTADEGKNDDASLDISSGSYQIHPS